MVYILTRQLLNHSLRGEIFEEHVGSRRRRRRGDAKGQGMAARNAMHPRRNFIGETRRSEERTSGIVVKWAELHHRHGPRHPNRSEPRERRQIPAHDDEPGVARQRRKELPPEPGLGDAERLVPVDPKYDAAAHGRKARHGISVVALPDRPAQLTEEAARGRLDAPAVDPEDGCAAFARTRHERPEQRGFTDAGDAVDERDERTALLK